MWTPSRRLLLAGGLLPVRALADGLSHSISSHRVGGGPSYPQVGGANPNIFADFVNSSYLGGGASRTTFAAWLAAIGGTFSRSSSATYIGAGIVQTAAANVPRLSTLQGIRLTGPQTELTLWNRDLTNAAWTKTSVTAALSQTGADGAANAASGLTATGANGTVTQAITRASAARITGAFLKRISGSGAVTLSQDNFVTTTAVVPTGAWAFYPISAAATLANPVLGIKLGTSGDVIAVDFVSHQEASFIADVIPTTTAQVTQAADSLSFPYTQTTMSALAIVNGQLANSAGDAVVLGCAQYDAPIYIHILSSFFSINNVSGIASGAFASPLAVNKACAAGSPTGRSVTCNGQAPVSDANKLLSAAPASLVLGSYVGGFQPIYGNINQVAIWNGVVASAADMQRLTT